MKVVYSPEGAEIQTWHFDPDKVRRTQAELIEKRYGKNWDEFLQDVRGGSMGARTVLFWHLLRLTHHTLRFEDTPDYAAGELKVSYDLDELLTIRDRVLKSGLSAEDKEAVLAALDVDISEAMADEPEDVSPAGKAEEVGLLPEIAPMPLATDEPPAWPIPSSAPPA